MTAKEKSGAIRATVLPASETLQGSIEGTAKAPEVVVTDGTITPSSLQTSEGSFVEKAMEIENVPYLKGWRLHFLSIRSALLDPSRYFTDDHTAWLFCFSLSTSKSP